MLATASYVGRATSGKPPRDALFQYGVAASQLVFELIILGVVLWIARGIARGALGWRAPRSWGDAFGLALALLVAIVILEVILEPLLHASREQGLEPSHWEPAKAVPFALNAAIIVVVAPFVEELTYRGLGIAVLHRFGPVVAVVGTAAAFAGAHGLVQGFPALFLFGVAVAILRLRTGSVFPGMLFHACFNGIGLALAFV